ncbi:MAG: transglycosylase SLT domain-containing protein [Nitrospirota bacterium]
MGIFTNRDFRSNPGRCIFYVVAALFAILFLSFKISYAQDIPGDVDGKKYFKKGKTALEEGRFDEAVRNLSVAGKEFCLLEDYALFYLSEAYHGMGNHDKSLDAVRTLLEKYPASLLRKKARFIEIRETKEISGENLSRLFESYVRDYPEDEEISYMYGLFLKETGEKAKAVSVFRDIYLKAGALSKSAYDESDPQDISSEDLVARAVNLMNRYEFNEAENDMRKALLIDDGRKKEEILKNLGLSLFRQKKYREAAEIYGRINDTYYKARSLYRAGDKEGLEPALDELRASNDMRAGYLLLAVASDKRREKDFENALRIYNSIIKDYPPEKEEAMWGIGWTYYISGEYEKAAATFSELYSLYEDPKYLYWLARSTEAKGENADDFYNSLRKTDANFYNALSYARNGGKIAKSISLNDAVFDFPGDRPRKFERVEALQSLEMPKETVMELISLSKSIESPFELIYIISKFHELGEFRRAVGLVTKMPYSEKFHRFLYPLAFRDTVEQISKKYGLDPFVALSVIREESRFDADAKSPAGALGLMQLMPRTAFRLNKGLNLGLNRTSQINDIKINIHIGIYYLKSLFNEFNSLAHVLAAYNAGELAVRKWQQQGNYKSVDEFIEDIPYPETRNYVKKVITSYFQYKKYSSEDSGETGLGIILGKF